MFLYWTTFITTVVGKQSFLFLFRKITELVGFFYRNEKKSTGNIYYNFSINNSKAINAKIS